MEEIVSHELRVANKVFELELEQLGRRFLFINQVQTVHLVQHLFLDDRAPDRLDVVRPVAAHTAQHEQVLARKVMENVLLQN